MQPLLTQLLGLPGIEVEDYHDFGHKIILEVEARTEIAACTRCGQESNHLHQNHWYFARDLDISQRQVLLKINRRQFKCHSCSKPFSEELDFIGIRRKHTDRYAQSIVQQVLHSDTHNVALNNDLTDEEVWSMVKYMSLKKLNIDLSTLSRLGIDEIALRKGQKDFVVVLVDLDRHQLIGMAESRKQEDVKKVLSGWGVEVLEQIVEVSIDLWGNYKELVHKMLPNADIVADRFHVMKLVNQELNTARHSVIKANKENKNEAEKTRIEAALKQSKYALLKLEKRLTDQQKIKLEEVKIISPLLADMHEQKEEFREIFEAALILDRWDVKTTGLVSQKPREFQNKCCHNWPMVR